MSIYPITRSSRLSAENDLQEPVGIILAILSSDLPGVESALNGDFACVNSRDPNSGMNAPMLAAAGCFDEALEAIFRRGEALDFQFRDPSGNDLMEVAMQTLHEATLLLVEAAYERFAPHIVNNWPDPSGPN